MIPVRSERIYSIQSALKCARCELKLYIFTEVYDDTLVRAWRRCAAQIHEWMFRNKVNFSGFPCSGSREQWTLCREQWTLCREQWTLCREQWTLCREQWTLCREQWTLCREQWTLCREQWTLCREQWTLCREQWTLCREQWTLCREQWTLCREQWTLCREQWTLCREQWTLCREQWTLCREQWTLCREQWTLCREQWTLCREQWTLCREQWTLCREQWTLCREQWTLCREQWTLCREHVNRNTVHAWSALLTSWLSESGVLTKRDMQNMQSGGARGLELRTSALNITWKSPPRFYSRPKRTNCSTERISSWCCSREKHGHKDEQVTVIFVMTSVYWIINNSLIYLCEETSLLSAVPASVASLKRAASGGLSRYTR